MKHLFERAFARLWNRAPSRGRDSTMSKALDLGARIAEEEITRHRIVISQNRRAEHIAVLGKTGTGKSSLLRYLCQQDIHAGRGFVYFDLHGDTTPFLLPRLISHLLTLGDTLSLCHKRIAYTHRWDKGIMRITHFLILIVIVLALILYLYPRSPSNIDEAQSGAGVAQSSYVVDALPTLEGKRQIYAITEAESGVAIDLNIQGSHQWDFTRFAKTRDAFKSISVGMPNQYKADFPSSSYTLESDITSRNELAKYSAFSFFEQDSSAITIKGHASVQRIPLLGLKEVLMPYDPPFDKWIGFPLKQGQGWKDNRDVRTKIRTPNSLTTTRGSKCSLNSEREIVDQGSVFLLLEDLVQNVPCLVMHERVQISCSTTKTVGHIYYWINRDLGFLVYIAGRHNEDVAVFNRAGGIATLVRIENDPKSADQPPI